MGVYKEGPQYILMLAFGYMESGRERSEVNAD
jgi:hypothetical protein